MSDIDAGPDPGRAAREDELLVVRCQLGEPEAFDELIARWQAPLWTFVRRLAGREEAAGDLVQEVWLRVIRGLPRLRDGSKWRAWLFGIARRTMMDRLREQYARAPIVEMEAGEMPDLALHAADEREDIEALERGLARLPIVEREALTLFYLRELSLAEAAEVLGLPVGTVKSRLFRARQMLRRELTGG